jgi:hypothetical protein
MIIQIRKSKELKNKVVQYTATETVERHDLLQLSISRIYILFFALTEDNYNT